ncbi:MAG: bifunctional folylpolyglutamate synthase/dihydrofolate synthase [Bacteroidales bacterium]|nr:bifunctional folylpolyglutamate synthase/dihydrofolate synthase [Bacteroidales bacterium]MDD4672540.1 bifunctional folylpolyglutamate synthase/dihydrofolate synthase [Bacteroidales bacterium]MDY0349129.1 folylpolyglutamate synthase/dihydrofolate synthase family protein [Tenuifilaceae bacterium]
MDYQQTLSYLFTQLAMYQRVGKIAYKANLNNTLALDNLFSHPHKNFKTVHVAGTNGKGSTSHMLASILQNAGYKVGLYTSPHLVDFRERIKINGIPIDKDTVIDFVEKNKSIFATMKPSFFEMTVALAFKYFAEQEVDIAVVEVGLGGRLDSTNIISPELSVITNIGLDHTDMLGDTLELIAAEKAGIIKPNTPVVICETQPETQNIFIKIAHDNSAPIAFADQNYRVKTATLTNGKQELSILHQDSNQTHRYKLDLLGSYQQKNFLGILQAVKILKRKGYDLDNGHILEGVANVIKNTGLLGRWQILGTQPAVVCDMGHNAEGLKHVVNQINSTPHQTFHMVMGMVNDKNIDEALKVLPSVGKYYFTRAKIPRSLDEQELLEKAKHLGLHGESYPNVEEALRSAKNNALEDDLIVIGGSTFIVAEVLSLENEKSKLASPF